MAVPTQPCVEFKDIPVGQGLGYRERQKKALESCKEAGISREKAVSLVALSTRESNVEWISNREPQNNNWAPACYCRTAVGLELKRIDGVWYYRDEVATDVAARDYLVAAGMGSWTGWALRATGPALHPNSHEIAKFFEYIVARRARHLLVSISVGPTQMYMRYFNTGTCGWPETWEDLWSFYLSDTAGAAAERISYLTPGECIPETIYWPGSTNGGNKANCVRWLARHVGGSTVQAEAYYEGSDISDPSKSYKNALWSTNKQADEIGY
jgi:hypothetical protein